MYNRIWIACLAVVATGCGGDTTPERADGSTTSPAPVSQEQYRLAQARHADSVLSHLKTAEQLVRDLGAGYAVGPARLRDSLATLADATSCFRDGQRTDPYLAGTVAFLTRMDDHGSRAVQVQENATVWTSAAGNIVNSCLNVAAKAWRFDGRFGKAGRYITQVQFK